MLISVFRDMSSFLFFFGIVIAFFSVFLSILLNDLSDYEGIGPVAYFVIAMREAIGDYDTDSYAKNSDYKILTWMIYLMVMIMGNVVFMNFIIAVVSQSYESCMQKSTLIKWVLILFPWWKQLSRLNPCRPILPPPPPRTSPMH
jgi:hypothetical protein